MSKKPGKKVAKGVKKKAVKKSAAQKKKAAAKKTTASAKTMARSAVRSKVKKFEHDDPIIADNADVQLNFTHPPSDLFDGQLWSRSYTTFDFLEIEFTDGTDKITQPLEPVSSLTFSYAKPQSADMEELVFSTTDLEVLVIKVGFDKFKIKSTSAKQLLVPANLKGLRLKVVSGNRRDGQPFPPIELWENGKPKHNDVKITIHAIPETPHD